MKRSYLKALGQSETAVLKRDIQALVRAIVIKRDGGCILRSVQGISPCDGHAKDGHLILQADHLVTRSNSATYGDTRLIVCVCTGHHGWKKWHQKEYEAVVRTLLSPERVALWEKAEQDSWRPHRTSAMDWKLVKIALEGELRLLNPQEDVVAS